MDSSVAPILAKDEEKQIQGVGIRDELAGSLDDRTAYTEEEREKGEAEAVASAARANRG
jgi:hypothetical protein